MAPAVSPAKSFTLPLWYASRARATVAGSSPIGVGAVALGGAGEVGFGSYSSTTFLPPSVWRGRGGDGAAATPLGSGVAAGGSVVGAAVAPLGGVVVGGVVAGVAV